MKSGRMRQWLRIEQPGQAVDGFESPKRVWTPVFEQDGEATSVTGREYFGADRELGEVTWKIVMRENPDHVIQPNWRAVDVDSGAVYDFVAVLPSRQRDFLTIAAKSGSST